MKNKQFRARLRLLIILTLLLLPLIGFAAGKYIQTISRNETVTFTARLAESVELREHKAERTSTGEYTLSKTEYITNKTQSYILIPGLDIDKDPHIVITGKTDIPAYLYIEVVDSTPNPAITYQLEKHWQKTDKKLPQHKGTVYIFCSVDENRKPKPEKITADQTISIIEGNRICVGQKLLQDKVSDNLITFYAYLEEATD